MTGIFDSGAGGLSVLREIVKVLPQEKFVYYADNAYCPYGEKSAGFVTERAKSITEFLLGQGADIIVVACNTATSAAIDTLRREYSDASSPAVRERVRRLSLGRRDHVMFIGMEPAVKPAAAMTRSGVVGVLATDGTLRGTRYLDARDLYSDKVRIVEQPGHGFVEMVEGGHVDDKVVEASLRPLLDAGADVIVLGCSHYPFLLDALQKVAYSICPSREVRFIDPAPAVAARLVEVMRSEALLTAMRLAESLSQDGTGPNIKKPDVTLYASGSYETLRKLFASL